MVKYESNLQNVSPLLILGAQRSGTTLLASMLGRHSEINMLFESTGKDVFRLIGKRYQGNKLCLARQIEWEQRSSKLIYLANRVINGHFLGDKYQVRRVGPTSKLSVQDYLEKKAKIVWIKRPEEEVLDSMLRRTPMTRRQAEAELKKVKSIESRLQRHYRVDYHELTQKPKEILTAVCNYLDIDFQNEMLNGPEFNVIYPQKSINPR
jgi:hypothetical protein